MWSFDVSRFRRVIFFNLKGLHLYNLILNSYTFEYIIRPAHAVAFATVSGIVGLSILYYEVNSVTAMLGAANIILYTLFYTPMKRISIVNTWVGSIGEYVFYIYCLNNQEVNWQIKPRRGYRCASLLSLNFIN